MFIKLFKENGFQTTEIGKAFGTIEALYENFSLHITTFREDSYDETSRKPDIISSNNLENDLKFHHAVPTEKEYIKILSELNKNYANWY